MSKLDELWAYQQVDLQLDAVNARIKGMEEYKILKKLKDYILDTKNKMQRIEDNANKIIEEFAALEQRHNNINAKLIECQEKMRSAGIEETESLAALQKEMKSISEEVQSIEKEIKELMAKSEKQTQDYASLASAGSKRRREYDKVKVDYQAKKAVADEEAAQIEAQLKALAKNVDKDYLIAYKKIKANKPVPMAELKDNRCMGCYMELPPVFTKKVQDSQKPVECENCGRILIIRA